MTTTAAPVKLPRHIESQVERSGLGDIYAKVAEGVRLSAEDGIRLFEASDILSLGALANIVRERKNGDYTYFNRNLRIDYTNICNKQCLFCAFDRLPGEIGGYVLGEKEIAERFARYDAYKITEVHMVGGINPKLPFSYYTDLLRSVKRLRPDIHIKAFTMVEIAQMIRISKMSAEDTIAALKEAGLGSCPGGGAEVLVDRVHKELFRLKIGPKQWIDLQKIVHQCGLKTTATMLYGHIETLPERIEHLVRLRELQDETGGFQTFIPLAFHPRNTELSHLAGPTGMDDIKNIAVARLMLDNFDHIKAYWIMMSPALSQMSLWFGADDIDGTVLEETIVHEAGATTPTGLTVETLLRTIREAGRTPVERDTVYNILQVF
ncbi:MAG: aminofutalosine synthase MqnE [Candidatus Sumerlaeaceae bacterium]|nr:aminofutalosine synthase MqnE [Candidatus Sumerlaeaceae bacterium]